MITVPRSTLVGLSLVAGCMTPRATQSTNPDTGTYDGYYKPGGGVDAPGDDLRKPKPRLMTSSGRAGENSATTRELLAKRPPIDGDPPRPTQTPSDPNAAASIAGIVPNTAGAGSVAALYGTGLGDPSLEVWIGDKKSTVKERADDRVTFVVPAVSGQVSVRTDGKTIASTSKALTALQDDSLFGRPNASVAHGLLGRVYAIGGSVTELPAFGELGAPVAIVAVDELDMGPGTLAQAVGGQVANFGAHFEGSLNVTASGDYDLCLNAGDGAQLYLDESLIIDNDGVHEAQEICEALYIEAGEYKLDLLWFQADQGEMGLQLLWSKDGGAKAIVPASALFPPDASDFVTP